MTRRGPTFKADAGAYALPASGELPPGRVGRRLDPPRAGLLLHDLQGYYLSALHPEVASALVGNVRRLAGACRGTGPSSPPGPWWRVTRPRAGPSSPRDRGSRRPGLGLLPLEDIYANVLSLVLWDKAKVAHARLPGGGRS